MINPTRMQEIAEKAVSCLCNDETIEDLINWLDLTNEEKEFFGIEEDKDNDY